MRVARVGVFETDLGRKRSGAWDVNVNAVARFGLNGGLADDATPLYRRRNSFYRFGLGKRKRETPGTSSHYRKTAQIAQ